MTNLEWLRSLSMDELGNIIFGSNCSMCAYKERVDCPTNYEGHYDCKGGFKEWCNAIHVPQIKPCLVCKGSMDIRWHNGYYLICEDCGLLFGLDTGMAEQGIIEGDYEEEVALIDAWNKRVDND